MEREGQAPTNEYGLTDRQWRFVNEYLIDFNQKRAAIRAGYTEKSAKNAGAQLVRHEVVRRAIQDMLDDRAHQWSIEHGRIIQELQAIAFANMKQFAQWDTDGVQFVDSDTIDDARAAAVVEIKKTVDKNGTERMSLKLGDKLDALKTLAKISGLMRDKPVEENRGAFARWADEMRADQERHEAQQGEGASDGTEG